MYKKYKSELNRLDETSSKRFINDISHDGKYVLLNSKKLLNLSSNDYLGIASNKDIIDEFNKKNKYLYGSTSSRLLSGSSPVYVELEELISKLYIKEASLIFNSGYHANVGIFSSLIAKKDVIFSDKLNHASIIDGIKLSGSDFYRYNHLDYNHLEELLKNHRNNYETAIIVSESVFSMDGDLADINKLIELKNKYNAILAIDEAHAFGIFGDNALGVSELQGCIEEVDLIIATFGKAIGSVGAFCTSKKIIIDYLINKARSFIFSTSLPEVNIAYSKYIIENILPHTKCKRSELLSVSDKLRTDILANGLKTLGSSHIIPIIIGNNDSTVKLSTYLQDKGFYILPIRYPTVKPNSSRLRLSLRADINYEEIRNIPKLIAEKLL